MNCRAEKVFLKTIAILAIISASLICAGVAYPNSVSEFSLGQKVSRSSLVVIGKVVANRTAILNSTGVRIKYSHVFIEKTLKGKKIDYIDVLTETMISENDPSCCVVAGRYLFFLQPTIDGGYQSINGRFGIVSINP
jgi:hypothetical protein